MTWHPLLCYSTSILPLTERSVREEVAEETVDYKTKIKKFSSCFILRGTELINVNDISNCLNWLTSFMHSVQNV